MECCDCGYLLRPQHCSSCFCTSSLHELLHALQEKESTFRYSVFGMGKWKWAVSGNGLNTLALSRSHGLQNQITPLGILDKMLYLFVTHFFFIQDKRGYDGTSLLRKL